jgi:hypothetical protein
MGEYQAVAAYFGVAFVVFIGGILWNKYRASLMRRFRIKEYRNSGGDNPAVHAPH